MPTSPVVARRELVLRIRQRRKELGVTASALCKELGFTPAYWSLVEGYRNMFAEDKLMQLAERLEFDPAERQELIALRTAAKERGWWSQYSALLTENQSRFYGLECGAQSIRTYESLLMPGLLQTANYARALISADSVITRQMDIEPLVQVRIRRQERLTSPEPLHLSAVICEAALLNQFGGLDVLREQLEHLIQCIEKYPDTIDIRVIPFVSPRGAIIGGPTFHLIDFDNTELPPVAWHESAILGGLVEDADKVRNLGITFKQAYDAALGAEETLALIKQHLP